MESWEAVIGEVTNCFESKPRNPRYHVPLLDKASKLAWTLREHDWVDLLHLLILRKRGEIELHNPVDGDEGKKLVSDLIVRGLRGLKLPPRTRENELFYRTYFHPLLKLCELGVRRDVAEELFRTHFHDLESWTKKEGSVECLSRWASALLRSALFSKPVTRTSVRRLWDKPRRWQLVSPRCSEGPGVKTGGRAPFRYGGARLASPFLRMSVDRLADSMPCGQDLTDLSEAFLLAGEYELTVRLARAEVALAESVGEQGKSLTALMHGLHALGRLTEAEQHHRAFLLRVDVTRYDRATGLNSLARVLRDQGRLSEALEKAEEATAMAITIPEARVPMPYHIHSFLDTCTGTEASILERMGRLEEAVLKDKTKQSSRFTLGTLMRFSLWCVTRGSLENATLALRRLIALASEEDNTLKTDIEGPHVVVRAKELLCQVLHRQRGGGGDPEAEAEEAALRAELRQEEARRGEALREVRALVRRVAGEAEEGKGEEAKTGAAAPKSKKKKQNKKGKRGRKTRAATATARDEKGEEEKESTGEAAAAPAAGTGVVAVGLAPPRVDEGLEANNKEEAEDKDDCPVCLQPLGAEGEEEEEEEEKGVLTCGHEYHVACLDAWVSTCVRKRLEVTCPSCRAPVNRDQDV
jgi:tetratricopeptide (TPR) repeat protein